MSEDVQRSERPIAATRDPQVTIVVPTFRRPQWLRANLRSCLAQEGVAPESVEIVVVDNCPDGSAAPVVDEVALASPVLIRYLHETRPGISHARNTGMARARGRFVAFIDDDEAATPNWLADLLATRERHDADVVFAPVLPKMPEAGGQPGSRSFFTGLFTYSIDHPTGSPVGSSILTPFWSRGGKAYHQLASGNCLIAHRGPKVRDVRFDPQLGLTGGEDTLYFNQLAVNGARFVWCAEAIAFEQVPADRLSLRWALRRAFRGGQATSRTPMLLNPRRPGLTVLSMAIGTAQAPIYALLGCASALVGSPRRYGYFARAASALGKLLWLAPFRGNAYGAPRPSRDAGNDPRPSQAESASSPNGEVSKVG